MEPAATLEYRGRPDDRSRWVTRLAIASAALGTLGVLAALARSRQAWEYVFDPTFRWNYPPQPWVCPVYLATTLAEAVAWGMLATAGITSLIKPDTGLRFHLWCAAIVIFFVVLTAVLRAMQLLPHPDVPAASLAVGVLIEFALFGAYPAIVVFVVLRSSESRNHPAAG